MKFLLSIILVSIYGISATQSQVNTSKIIPSESVSTSKEAVAYFAEGCFWHAEMVFQSLVGVRDAVSGYAGGQTNDPTYEQVSTGETGHAEAVKVYYDPGKVSFSTLVRAFFASQDPTTLNRQGNDVGSEYRSIAFYKSEGEREIIETVIKSINDSKKYRGKVVTQVVSFTKFYNAENYHQEYIPNNPDNSYVRNVSVPDFKRFKTSFKEGVFKK